MCTYSLLNYIFLWFILHNFISHNPSPKFFLHVHFFLFSTTFRSIYFYRSCIPLTLQEYSYDQQQVSTDQGRKLFMMILLFINIYKYLSIDYRRELLVILLSIIIDSDQVRIRNVIIREIHYKFCYSLYLPTPTHPHSLCHTHTRTHSLPLSPHPPPPTLTPPHLPYPTHTPTGMLVHPNHQHVDREGFVNTPYLTNWTASSSLRELITVLSSIFSDAPPLFSR